MSQQLDETSCSEQPQEAQVDEVILQHRRRTQSFFNKHPTPAQPPLTKHKNQKTTVEEKEEKDRKKERERGRKGGRGESKPTKHNQLQT